MYVFSLQLLEPGDIVPVDGIYLNGHNLKCDESSATGESDEMKKDEEIDPFILSGSKVLEGVGRCVVIAVGKYFLILFYIAFGIIKLITNKISFNQAPIRSSVKL